MHLLQEWSLGRVRNFITPVFAEKLYLQRALLWQFLKNKIKNFIRFKKFV